MSVGGQGGEYEGHVCVYVCVHVLPSVLLYEDEVSMRSASVMTRRAITLVAGLEQRGSESFSCTCYLILKAREICYAEKRNH